MGLIKAGIMRASTKPLWIWLCQTGPIALAFANDLGSVPVIAQRDELRMAKPILGRPFHKLNRCDEARHEPPDLASCPLRLDPLPSDLRRVREDSQTDSELQTAKLGEHGLSNSGNEPGANASGVSQIAAVRGYRRTSRFAVPSAYHRA